MDRSHEAPRAVKTVFWFETPKARVLGGSDPWERKQTVMLATYSSFFFFFVLKSDDTLPGAKSHSKSPVGASLWNLWSLWSQLSRMRWAPDQVLEQMPQE